MGVDVDILRSHHNHSSRFDRLRQFRAGLLFDDDGLRERDIADHELRRGVQFRRRREHDRFRRARGERALDRGFLEVAGAQPCARVHASHAHEVQVGMDARNAFHRGGADGHDRMLVEPPANRINDGGGVEAEGEDLEVNEMSLQAALRAVDAGEIVDGKTIMLLQYVALRGFASARAA
jgi:hypothetical protein